jgi:hypothetical protein
MQVVAGPSGSGKSALFPVAATGVDHFNVDDRCAHTGPGGSRRGSAAFSKAQSSQPELVWSGEQARDQRVTHLASAEPATDVRCGLIGLHCPPDRILDAA